MSYSSHCYITAAAILISVYILHSVYQALLHIRRRRAWHCKAASVRPYRLPFGIDILQRYYKADLANESNNDAITLYNEMRGLETWQQQICGNWHYVTNDPGNIKALLATQFKDFELGPIRRGSFAPLTGNGIFTLDGKGWEHSRAMLRPQFARNQIADLRIEEEHVQLLLSAIPLSTDSWTDVIDLKPLFFNLTLDSASHFLFGESVFSQKSQGRSQTDWAAFGVRFDNANAAINMRYRLMSLYWLHNPKSFRDDCAQVHRLVDNFVDEAIAAKKAGLQCERYVFSHELAKISEDRIELRSQLLNILLAGRDTTAGLLSYTFYFLARHPAVYQKLREQILSDFGFGLEKISFESLKACTFLQHVMNEVLRLEPSVPENARTAVRNTTLPRGGGAHGESPIYVGAGTEVVYSVRTMHRRTDIWGEDAHEFKPERWQMKRRMGWEFLPFNGGPRICLGQQFALTEAGYVIVRMLQKFDKIDNMDTQHQKHVLTSTSSPVAVLVRMHAAGT